MWHNNGVKAFWLFNHPAPYKVDFFNVLGQEMDLDVIFERAYEKGRNKDFYNRKPIHFSCEIAKSIYLGGIDNYTTLPIKKLKNNAYDLIVINGWRTLTEQKTIRYLKKNNIPYVFHINGGIINDKEASWKTSYKRKYISGAALYLAPDEASAKYLIHYGADPKKIRLYPYSTVFDEETAIRPLSESEKSELRSQLGLEGKCLYCSIGQYIERKNHVALIRLWKQMEEDSHLYIIGEGPLKETYEKLIEEEQLHNVHLVLYMPHEQLFPYLRAFDAFVLLSKEDIYGHVITEAMAQGLPVVASDKINAAKKLVEEGVTGYVVPLDEEKAISKALHDVLNPKMGETALLAAKGNTVEASAKLTARIFREWKEENL